MKTIIISSSPFIFSDNTPYAYSPYVKELEIWARHLDEIAFFCPIWKNDKGLLISKISFSISKMYVAKEFNIKTLGNLVKAIQYSFLNFYKIYQSMKWADHIHLRCPGNIGLMGCLVQIMFPRKSKTAKYAGNWDPNSDQPWSYRMQRWILSNPFLSRNMNVLVYGEWEGSSKNVKPFFTASYNEADKTEEIPRRLDDLISFVFVGTLSAGKRPLYAIKLIEHLFKDGVNAKLSLYGNGKENAILQRYILENNLQDIVSLEGNQPQEIIKNAYQKSHFVILPSESEGWPKVIAEGMFWGCLPVATKVSCVPTMLDKGNRGILLNLNIKDDAATIKSLVLNDKRYQDMVRKSMQWSRNYTLDFFENEISALLKS